MNRACETCRRRKIKCEIINHMIDRLETNIRRLESHFQKIGFHLGEDENEPSFIEGSEQSDESSPSSAAENADSINGTGAWDSEPIHMDAQQDPSAAPQNVYPTMLKKAPDDIHTVIPEDLPCFYVPRCFTDAPNPGFSALSPEGKKWITNKTQGGSVGNLESLLPLGLHQGTSQRLLEGLFPDKHFCPLPPKDEIISLVNDYLQQFNSLIPIFQPSSLLSLCEDDNLQSIFDSPGRWASLNVALAMGYMLRIENNSSVHSDRQKGWLFMKNALGVLNGLCFGLPDLWAVQALLGMVVFLMGTLSSQPCGYLISSVVRICHQIRLERSENESGLCPEEVEQRRRIFWIAYCLDKEISLRAGIPIAQRDDDMDVLLPTEIPLDNIGIMPTTDRQETFNVLRSTCELALIKSQVHKHLYSVAARDRPLVEVAGSVAMLDEKLQQWKESIPTEFRPEPRRVSTFPQSPVAVVLLYLHLSYFNCLIAIHRITAAQESRLGIDLVKKSSVYTLPNQVIFMSESLCTKAATASINLIKYMPKFNITLVGVMIYYPIFASKTLSSTIVRNPRDASRTYHIGLIMQVETFVSSLALGKPNEGIEGLLKDCAEYRSLAEAAVKKASQICWGRRGFYVS
ncbi:Pc22g13810 [Penicillium rubens Wisconsin 54-1255]|uniref:Pc22g13810 protein n=2 Tax=Penicillium chrysogenum species complex TaxID=254878 RepID=B6HTN2_PENRW|nr:Pc22g13810 [Penicillium rubens Wisconsin 54-1255]